MIHKRGQNSNINWCLEGADLHLMEEFKTSVALTVVGKARARQQEFDTDLEDRGELLQTHDEQSSFWRWNLLWWRCCEHCWNGRGSRMSHHLGRQAEVALERTHWFGRNSTMGENTTVSWFSLQNGRTVDAQIVRLEQCKSNNPISDPTLTPNPGIEPNGMACPGMRVFGRGIIIVWFHLP